MCPEGQYKSPDMSTCEICPSHAISETQGNSECTDCPGGKQADPTRTKCGENLFVATHILTLNITLTLSYTALSVADILRRLKLNQFHI